MLEWEKKTRVFFFLFCQLSRSVDIFKGTQSGLKLYKCLEKLNYWNSVSTKGWGGGNLLTLPPPRFFTFPHTKKGFFFVLKEDESTAINGATKHPDASIGSHTISSVRWEKPSKKNSTVPVLETKRPYTSLLCVVVTYFRFVRVNGQSISVGLYSAIKDPIWFASDGIFQSMERLLS